MKPGSESGAHPPHPTPNPGASCCQQIPSALILGVLWGPKPHRFSCLTLRSPFHLSLPFHRFPIPASLSSFSSLTSCGPQIAHLKGKMHKDWPLDPQIIETQSAKFVCPLVLAEAGQGSGGEEKETTFISCQLCVRH